MSGQQAIRKMILYSNYNALVLFIVKLISGCPQVTHENKQQYLNEHICTNRSPRRQSMCFSRVFLSRVILSVFFKRFFVSFRQVRGGGGGHGILTNKKK